LFIRLIGKRIQGIAVFPTEEEHQPTVHHFIERIPGYGLLCISVDFRVPAVEECHLRFILKVGLVEFTPFPVYLLVSLLGNNPTGITTVSLASDFGFILVFVQFPAFTLGAEENIVLMMIFFQTIHPAEIIHPVIGTTHFFTVDIDGTGVRIGILLVILIIVLVIVIAVIVKTIGRRVQAVIPPLASPVVRLLGIGGIVLEGILVRKAIIGLQVALDIESFM